MNEKVVKDIIQTRKIIRKKYNTLKSGKSEDAAHFERIFEPITLPLKKLSKKRLLKDNDDVDDVDVNQTFKHEKLFSPKTPLKPLSSSSSPPRTKEDLYAYDDDDHDDFDANDNSISFMSSPMHPTNRYFDEVYKHIHPKDLDHKYGPHFDVNEQQWKIGNLPFSIANSNIFINDQVYPLTGGLQELLLLKQPKSNKYQENDISVYLDIAKAANLLHRNFDSTQQYAGNTSRKYKFIKSLMTRLQRRRRRLEEEITTSTPLPTPLRGSGLMKYSNNALDYIYWDDPNELIDRLRLLLASQAAGHSNHNNEIVSIVEELREANIII